MTREEAIARIKEHMFIHKMNEPRAIHISEALDMAIKALEQQPCEDAISRKEVMNQIFYSTDNSGDVVLGSNLRKRIKALPPVTPTRKKGKWINKSQKSGCEITFVASECTCCGKNTFFDCDELLYRYCPNCGAEMESEE